MIGSQALLVFGLLTGIVAEQCDLGEFTIDDFRNNVVVTNASENEGALVLVTFDRGEGEVYLGAGKSATFQTLVATKYRITVILPDTPSGLTYEDSLLNLRDLLQDLSLDSSAPADAVADVLTQLFLVQSAIQQLKYEDTQSCGNKIGDGVDSRATLTWTETIDGSGLWVLDCG